MKDKVKPRNAYVVLAKLRKAGAMEKSKKSIRAHEKAKLKKEIRHA